MATLKLKDNIIDRLERVHGFANDSAFAGAIGVSPSVLHAAKNGKSSSVRVITGICHAFGYGPGEIAEVVAGPDPSDPDDETSEEAVEVAA